MSENAKCCFLGAMANSDVMEYYKTHDVNVFINVCENEGIPVSIMEAMSFGKPVIAIAVGGTAEIIDDGKTGYLLGKGFDIQKIAALTDNIAKAKSEDYIIMSETVRKRWEKMCDASANYKEFYTELNRIIGGEYSLSIYSCFQIYNRNSNCYICSPCCLELMEDVA